MPLIIFTATILSSWGTGKVECFAVIKKAATAVTDKDSKLWKYAKHIPFVGRVHGAMHLLHSLVSNRGEAMADKWTHLGRPLLRMGGVPFA